MSPRGLGGWWGNAAESHKLQQGDEEIGPSFFDIFLYLHVFRRKMLTGIEPVGLALSIIPIFQAASGNSKIVIDQAKTVLSAAQRDEKLEDFYENLHFELSMLQMVVLRLVSELDLEDAEKEGLKGGEGPLLWSDQIVVNAVRNRLGVGYDTFQTHLRKFLEQLEKLVRKEDTTKLSNSQGQQIDARGLFIKLMDLRSRKQNGRSDSDLLLQFRFALTEDKRARIMEKLAKYNARLAHLLDFWFCPITEPNEGMSRRHSRHVRLRPLMHSLYHTMGHLWPCACEKSHQARFCLLECPEPSDNNSERVYYSMLMSTHENVPEGHCRWLESKICIMLDSELPQPGKVKFVLKQPSVEPSPPSSPDGIFTRTLSGFGSIAPPRTQPSPAITPDTIPPVLVENLCKEICASANRRYCPQMLFDGKVLYKTRPAQNKLFIEASLPGKSLADLLLEKRPFTFSLRERRILAVILAHSFLHFGDSPWLSRHWDKSQIFFLHRTTKQGHKLDLRWPWITITFQPPTELEDVDRYQRIHPNPSILALGILLLEIELRTSIESSRTEEDLTPDGLVDCNTNFFTAKRLLEHNLHDVFDGYKKAVSACVTCNFVEQGASTSLDDEEFRHAVYENIVAPLEQELEFGFCLKAKDLGLESI